MRRQILLSEPRSALDELNPRNAPPSVGIYMGGPLDKLHLRGRGGGLVASVNNIRVYGPSGDRYVAGFAWHNLPYPDLERVTFEPTKGWFRDGWRLTLRGFDSGLLHRFDLPGDAGELAREATKQIQVMIDARDFELRRNYRLGQDLDFQFDCALCGTRSGSVEAVLEKQRLVVERLGLPIQAWDRLQTGTPLTVDWIELTRGMRYQEAIELLDEAQRLLLVVLQRKQPVIATTFCATCYRNAASPPAVEPLPAPTVRVRDAVPARLRFLILKRDAYRCTYCGKMAGPGVVLHVDHVIPMADGGPTTEDNLVTACDECNLGKSAGTVLD